MIGYIELFEIIEFVGMVVIVAILILPIVYIIGSIGFNMIKKIHKLIRRHKGLSDEECEQHNEPHHPYKPIIKTKADAEYRNKLLAKKKSLSKTKRCAVKCHNCNAPLKAIYERCEYCGSAYKELEDLPSQVVVSEDDDEC